MRCILEACTSAMLASAENVKSIGKFGGDWKKCVKSFARKTCASGVYMLPFGWSSGMSMSIPFFDKWVPSWLSRLAARWVRFCLPVSRVWADELVLQRGAHIRVECLREVLELSCMGLCRLEEIIKYVWVQRGW